MVKLKKIFFLALLLVWTARSAQATGKVIVASLTGTVGVQMEEFVVTVIGQAEEKRAGLVIFKLDTPGGLVEATRGITQAILSSKVPVVMWVPPGGRAASAGAFMMQAAHVSAMASGANVGAAHPVVAGGGDVPDGDMRKKVMNDLMAQMRSLTQLRGRNEKIAQRMIEESLSLTAHEALEQNAIDIVVDDLESLLTAIRGRTVEVDGKQVEIDLSAGIVENVEMNFQEQVIQFLSSPDIAYLLLTGGLLAIFYEIITPGGFVLGVTGAVMLLLGGIGLKMLPFNWAGVALVGAGVIVMGIDLLVGGTGLLSLLGVTVLVAGGMFLFRAPGSELLHVSLGAMTGMAVALGLSFVVFALMIARSLSERVTTGWEGLTGLDAQVTEDLAPEGMVKCRGEVWRARTTEGLLKKGESALVVAIKGMTLLVKAKK
ncbi:MAG: nodulation protein NfeD [Synergistaceae bacterium]|jgi:membrane-bound serine protease (ClpP class)|nr:nodulation protein NfeD [Synergistaceae bacterium]